MKKLILVIGLLMASVTLTFAQCGKKIALTSSKTDHIDAAGTVKQTVDENALIEIGKTTVDITISDNHEWTGTIKTNDCNWKTPYKEGKSIIKASMSNNHGEDKNITLTIEGKDGKVTLLFEMEGQPDERIRVGIDKFEEKG